MHSTGGFCSITHCRHRFRCLHCSDTNIFCDCYPNCHKDHPRQPLVSGEFLLNQYGSKVDYAEYGAINVFNCPYCDKLNLSIETLYDHITLEHLDVPFDVRCPICVCFGSNYSLMTNVHLSTHLVDDHSVSMEQYQEQILVYNTDCYDERELLIFLASTLPPTYHAQSKTIGESSSTTRSVRNQAQASSSNHPQTIERTCSICLDEVLSARTLPCQHNFHASCIAMWLQQNATCPVCRKPTL